MNVPLVPPVFLGVRVCALVVMSSVPLGVRAL
jgi:hypothetical protein